MPLSDFERFKSHIVSMNPGECWIWKSAECHYASFRAGGHNMQAHIYSYEHFVGKVPAGLVLDHTCRNSACVNPEHLEPVTTGENIKRGWKATHEGKPRQDGRPRHPRKSPREVEAMNHNDGLCGVRAFQNAIKHAQQARHDPQSPEYIDAMAAIQDVYKCDLEKTKEIYQSIINPASKAAQQ